MATKNASFLAGHTIAPKNHPIESALALLLTSPLSTSIVLLTILVILTYYKALPKPIPGIPYTQKSRWSLFGDAFEFVNYAKETGEGFRWFAKKSAELQSPIFQVFLAPFSNPIVVVADIQEIVDMSSRRSHEFDRGGFIKEWMGVLFPEGTIAMHTTNKFRLQRSVWASSMTSQFLNTVSAKTIHHHTFSLVKLWETKYRMGNVFEVSDDLKHATIWTAAIGNDLGLITSRIKAAKSTHLKSFGGSSSEVAEFLSPDLPEIVQACHILVDHMKNMRGSVWLTATKIWTSMLPSWKKALQTKQTVMSNLVEASRNKFATGNGANGEATCAMDQVYKRIALAEIKGKSISHQGMIDEAFVYIVGGHETTQDTTRWSLKYLTANQDKQAKLRSALLELFPGAHAHNLPSASQLVSSEHPYVEASIQELLRISLTTPSWSRRTTREVTVLGHRIPANVDIFGAPSVQSMEDMDDFEIPDAIRSPTSRSRTIGRWERSTKGLYQPERWLNADGSYDHYAGPILPFGAGTRGCFGQKLARLELRMMIIMLVLSFDFKPIPAELASFRPNEVINRGPSITYIRPVLRT